MEIIVTGGAGMIGSNIVAGLNAEGLTDIGVVDDLSNGHKFTNLVELSISDYFHKSDFIEQLEAGAFQNIECIFHQGACSATTEWDGKYMMENNYQYSKRLYHWCMNNEVRFIYASSAAVYGNGDNGFRERVDCEQPKNVYGYSKWLFDQYLRLQPQTKTQTVGLRYFNVYGQNEQHKGSMASVAWHLHQQMLRSENPKLFDAWDGYAAGEQQRDFISVEDVVKVNLWLFRHPQVQGIFNCGTGRAEPFNAVAEAVIDFHGKGSIEYIDFPDHLKGAYQNYTQADMSALQQAGYSDAFLSVKAGVQKYLQSLS